MNCIELKYCNAYKLDLEGPAYTNVLMSPVRVQSVLRGSLGYHPPGLKSSLV